MHCLENILGKGGIRTPSIPRPPLGYVPALDNFALFELNSDIDASSTRVRFHEGVIKLIKQQQNVPTKYFVLSEARVKRAGVNVYPGAFMAPNVDRRTGLRMRSAGADLYQRS